MAGGGELLEHLRFQGLAARHGDRAQQGADLARLGQGQLQHRDAVLQLPGQPPFRRADHQGVGHKRQRGGQIAQPPADAGIIAVAMEILEQQDGPLFCRHRRQGLEGRHRIAGRLPLAIGVAAEPGDKIPAQQQATAEAPRRLFQQAFEALLLEAADPDDRRARADQQIQLVGQGAGGGHRLQGSNWRRAAQRGSIGGAAAGALGGAPPGDRLEWSAAPALVLSLAV